MTEITRAPRAPRASAYEQRCLERLLEGRGGIQQADAIRLLVDRCARYGCVYTKPSKAGPGMSECPGWCDALEAFDRQRALRARATTEGAQAKPGRLARAEARALERSGQGAPSTSDVLTLFLLAEKRKADGCVKDAPGALPRSGVNACPGWCGVAASSWDAWWQR